MRSVGVWLCLLGACDFPRPQVPLDAAPGGASPDAPAVIPGPGDKDGDGLKDNVDNCPAAPNAAQYDEDGDRVGDVCDNCPHLANAGQENVGETGAGQAADPVGRCLRPAPHRQQRPDLALPRL
ncbi:MAG: thrombospondin type 3 repeat-containing protein [Myxococcales bacterium]|nr:thrombospondin type 3 repeat-containing protein [Myxococcales bacterium]